LDQAPVPFSSFADCSALTSINVIAGNSVFASLNGVLFDAEKKTLLQVPEGKRGSYTVPSSVTTVDPGAMLNCKGLTSITLPSSVESFSPELPGCTALASFHVAPENSAYVSRDGVLFDTTETKLLRFPPARAGDYTIPAGVAAIELAAFSDCSALSSVVLSSGVGSIGTSYSVPSFLHCNELTAIRVEPGNPDFFDIDGVLFDATGRTLVRCPPGRGGTYTVPGSVTTIGSSAFYGCSKLQEVNLPSSLAKIDALAFAFSTGLSRVTIPSRTTDIGYRAFSNCSSLTGAVFLGNLPTLGYQAFFPSAPLLTLYHRSDRSGFSPENTGGYPTQAIDGPLSLPDFRISTASKNLHLTLSPMAHLGPHSVPLVSVAPGVGFEYSSDLSPGSWIDLGLLPSASENLVFIDSDPLRLSRRSGYYRAVLQP
jgi:hypothetical protein